MTSNQYSSAMSENPGAALVLAGPAPFSPELGLHERGDHLAEIAQDARDLVLDVAALKVTLRDGSPDHPATSALLDAISAGIAMLYHQIHALERAAPAWAVRSEAFQEMRDSADLLRVMSLDKASLLGETGAAEYRDAVTNRLKSIARRGVLLSEAATLGGD